MANVKIIADIGSCHMGNLEYAKEAISIAKDIGVDVLKFQLFDQDDFQGSGNVALSLTRWSDLWDYAKDLKQPITASVFDEHRLNFLINYHPEFIKFPFSRRDRIEWIQKCHRLNIKTLVSTNVLGLLNLPQGVETLYCIPQYPVPFQCDFIGLFPLFDGFSDHTMGFGQTLRAVDAGAQIIEKHMTLMHEDINCPDDQFALVPQVFEMMIKEIRR